jgi:Rod binding domain-containing protein
MKALEQNIDGFAGYFKDEGKIEFLKNQKAIDEKNVQGLAEEYSAVMFSKMLQNMFESLGEDPLFGGGKSEKIFRSMLLDEYAKEISIKDEFGLTASIKAEILKLQGVENGGTSTITE